jgi:hypothetical protein
MTLGLDFYDTITTNPKKYKQLADTVIKGGGAVCIITAVEERNVKRARNAVRTSHVPHTHLEVLTYTHWHEVPALKRQACQRLHVDIMIDDRQDVREALSSRILALAP